MNVRRPIAALAAIVALTALGADPIEGRWQIHGHGAIIDIIEAPGVPGNLEVLAVDCPDMSIAPGTRLGTMTPGGRPGTYDCSMITDPRGDSRSGRGERRSMAVTLHGDRLEFKFYNRGVQVSLRRWLPYLFRITVVSESNRPDWLDGASRVDDSNPTFITI